VKRIRRNNALVQAEIDQAKREIAVVLANAQTTGVLDRHKLDQIQARLEKLIGKP
jgi:hypothetical protein